MSSTQVTFLKDHPSGIKAGFTTVLGDKHAARLADEGYVSVGENQKANDEPEFIDYVLTKKDIKEKTYPGIPDDAKVGDVIQIPNPNYVPNV